MKEIRELSRNFFLLVLVLALSIGKFTYSQQAQVFEEMHTFKTYPFSDPSPVPLMGRIYPYFAFEGYSFTGTQQEWKMVTLENPYIKVLVAPEIGGKVWGAVEKESGRAFIYFNKVVKFRDIAMRGPWTSGGIEFNFGAIGHTPTTATPVDYLIRQNDDGSVSCFVGAMDLPSRTQWRVEIKLHPDKAYFETNGFWYNPSPLHQSYYHWMNAAADASPDLHFCYPGNYAMGHDGNVTPWPINAQGRDVSYYANNDFGSSKSYHITGVYDEHFGGYWQDSDFGYGHWALYDEKPGKKLWIWSLARDGEIWRDLLTDKEGNLQYIEMQTGLLFNQAAGSSSRTPFKHAQLLANEADVFHEIWFPIKDIGGLVDGSPYGSLNVRTSGSHLAFGICALQNIDDDLIVRLGDRQAYKQHLQLEPLEVFIDSVALGSVDDQYEVTLGDGNLHYSSTQEEELRLSRPFVAEDDFDWASAEGLYIDGLERARQRDFATARNKLEQCLQKQPNHLRALTLLAEICYRLADYEKGLEYARKALSIDAYDGGANFIYGVINRKLGRWVDAKDGFGWAARSMAFRSAAYAQMAEIFLIEKNYQRAIYYAKRALDFNRYNLNAHRVQAICYRLQDDLRRAEEIVTQILAIDPLNHFARFERYLMQPDEARLREFTSMIRNELPHETYLELAISYFNLGLTDEVKQVLVLAPKNATIYYWLAYLNQKNSSAQKWLKLADDQSPFLVFPFRNETIPVLQWASDHSTSWKPTYYLGLICRSKNRVAEAEELFSSLGQTPDFAPFYLIRSVYIDSSYAQQLHDLKTALSLDAKQWRSWHQLTGLYLKNHFYEDALITARTAYQKFPKDQFVLAMDYAQALLYTGRYKQGLDLLDKTTILPYEGAGEGHRIHRAACLLYAAELMEKGRYQQAIEFAEKAKTYPEHLGVGRPYDVDERLEDYLIASCNEKLQRDISRDYYRRISDYTTEHWEAWSSMHYVSYLAYLKLGKQEQADQLLSDWQQAAAQDDWVLRWVLAKAAHDERKAQGIIATQVEQLRGPPWDPSGGDRNFRIVAEVIAAIEK